MLTQLFPFLDPVHITPDLACRLRALADDCDHPIHGDRMVMTTQLWFADPDGLWIRTVSRFYRLAAPADPSDIRRILTSVAKGGDHDGTED